MLRFAAALATSFLLGWGIATEVRTSYLQSRLLSRWAADMKFTVQPGPSEDIRFPKSGPYDERLGYAQLPSFIDALNARHFAVTQQARWSLPLERFVDQGGYPIYGERSRAGVKLFDAIRTRSIRRAIRNGPTRISPRSRRSWSTACCSSRITASSI